MEARMLTAGIAALAAFGLGFGLFHVLVSVARRRANALGESLSPQVLARWRLRNGAGFALPLARILLRSERVRAAGSEYRLLLTGREIESSDDALLSVFLAAVFAASLAASLLARNAICLFVIPLCMAVLVFGYAGHLADRRAEQMQASLPVALESMSACFGAGYTLLQTFRQVSKDAPGPVGAVFLSAANVLEAGGGAHEALEIIRKSDQSDEIAFVAVALDIQHQTGGSVRQVLDAAADSVKGELELKKTLRVQTAQAKLSARVVSVMPIALIALFSLVSPTFMLPFFQSLLGLAMLGLALIMQAAGVLLVRRALSVGGEGA